MYIAVNIWHMSYTNLYKLYVKLGNYNCTFMFWNESCDRIKKDKTDGQPFEITFTKSEAEKYVKDLKSLIKTKLPNGVDFENVKVIPPPNLGKDDKEKEILLPHELAHAMINKKKANDPTW